MTEPAGEVEMVRWGQEGGWWGVSVSVLNGSFSSADGPCFKGPVGRVVCLLTDIYQQTEGGKSSCALSGQNHQANSKTLRRS